MHSRKAMRRRAKQLLGMVRHHGVEDAMAILAIGRPLKRPPRGMRFPVTNGEQHNGHHNALAQPVR